MKLIPKNDLETIKKLEEIDQLIKSEFEILSTTLNIRHIDVIAMEEFIEYINKIEFDETDIRYHECFMEGIKKLTPTQYKMYNCNEECNRLEARKLLIMYENNEYCNVTEECPNKLEIIRIGGTKGYVAYCGDHKLN